MAGPLLIAAALVLVAFLLIVAAGELALQKGRRDYRRLHPSVKERRKELEIEVKLGDITDDEYAEKTIALDHEEAEAQLRRKR